MELTGENSVITPEGVFIIGPVVGKAFSDGLKLK